MRARRPRRKILLAAVIVLIAAVNGFLAYIGVYGGNVHVVIPGVLVRSAQLSGGTLEHAIEANQIKSILNLRGASPDRADYRSEIEISKRLGIAHDDFDLSAHRLPPPQDLVGILKDFDTLPKPMMIHCKGGADRTGLVSTLFLSLQPGETLDDAEPKELSWHFGHFAIFGTQAMDDFFTLYRKTSNGQSLRDWILKTYPAQYKALQDAHSWEVSPGPGHE